MLMGVGGTPEGVIIAAALKCLGGNIYGKLYPRNQAEHDAAVDFGFRMDAVITIDDLVSGDTVFCRYRDYIRRVSGWRQAPG